MTQVATPEQDGFTMPAEWSPHAATLMAWPLEADYWQGRAEQAREEWAGVARAVAAAEPVIMVCNPGDEQSVLRHCGSAVEVLPIPIDDSWMRDSGPIFVRNDAGEVSAVSFRFNAWGERFPSWANDDAMPAAVAAHLGVRLFEAPFVLEGGSILTDGERTLLTTEMCLLSSNRNPGMTKDEIERGLHEYLGVDTVVWLPYGMAGDVGPVATDGHVDGVATYLEPGRIALLVPDDPNDEDHDFGEANLAALGDAVDAHGRPIEVERLVGADGRNAYANCYIANGIVVAPMTGAETDERGVAQLGKLFPDREVIGVPAATIAFGGGGPHCITQQVPA
ncbi:MAG TPA: agmatine deiminase family protein [Actinomycetota bacterium]|jgi:agmatine deiminase|nr:agmatine deiminase family protein [Actinomycetota bacterium]